MKRRRYFALYYLTAGRGRSGDSPVGPGPRHASPEHFDVILLRSSPHSDTSNRPPSCHGPLSQCSSIFITYSFDKRVALNMEFDELKKWRDPSSNGPDWIAFARVARGCLIRCLYGWENKEKWKIVWSYVVQGCSLAFSSHSIQSFLKFWMYSVMLI